MKVAITRPILIVGSLITLFCGSDQGQRAPQGDVQAGQRARAQRTGLVDDDVAGAHQV